MSAASASAAGAAAPQLDMQKLRLAAEHIVNADVILVGTGAGMGVASSLGTFRGASAGVWAPLKKYSPPIPFEEMSNPKWFHKSYSPASPLDSVGFGLAFWQFRYQAYNGAPPHDGYHILIDWIGSKKSPNASEEYRHANGFSITSNIDGHWIRAGLAEKQVYEIHGTINHSQCALVPPTVNADKGEKPDAAFKHTEKCSTEVWPTPADEWNMPVDASTDTVLPPFPKCRFCQSLARPNVLMFGDWEQIAVRTDAQQQAYRDWLQRVLPRNNLAQKKICVIEIGAGVAIPTIRQQCQMVVRDYGENASFIRLNPEAPFIPTTLPGGGGEQDLTNAKSNGRLLSFTESSLDVLRAIDVEVKKLQEKRTQAAAAATEASAAAAQ